MRNQINLEFFTINYQGDLKNLVAWIKEKMDEMANSPNDLFQIAISIKNVSK